MKISTNNLHVELGNAQIINGISMDIESGKTIGIIGPNGSGKSTFLKTIYRVIKPSNGAVFIDETELSKISIKESAKKIAVVAQHNYYNFEFKVEEIVLMGRTPHKKRLDRNNENDYELARKSLEMVGLENFLHREFSTLSGGEQQRVILARALTQNSPCLILDEPTNHLDIRHQLEIMDIVTKLNKTVISAIHDLNIAAMYCDKLYVLKSGEIVCFGDTKDILTAQMIKDVFEVDAQVLKADDNNIFIRYKPI